MFTQNEKPPVVISVGGSLIVPNGGPDIKFLSKLNYFIRNQVKKGQRFLLVAGGGKIARHYRDAGRSVVGNITNEDLDWIAIHTTRLNAHLIRTIFQDIANPRIIINYKKKIKDWKEPVIVGAGWKPGWSTDYDAVLLAKEYKANLIINMSNIDWIYNKDPRKYKDAKIIKKITWEELEVLVGDKWTPGLNTPFDPIATKLAKKLKLTVIVTNGRKFNNLEKIIEGEAFRGTVIMPFKIDSGFYDRDYYLGKKNKNRPLTKKMLLGKIIDNVVHYYRAVIIKIFLKPKNCLDIGCGTGKLVYYLRKLGVDAYGIDISKMAIDLARKEVKPFIKIGNIKKIPYPDNYFDLVLTDDVMEHIERSAIKKSIKETVRVSKKYILHKIYTQENLWINIFQGTDFSKISVFNKKFWQKLILSLDNVKILRSSFFRLPSFFETIFLLKKIKK